jgi:TetR/AcrR family transcriptional regulator, transcriptional repressor for nem operon
MADSTPRRADKRERLVASARQVLHQQGVQKTTIADVAQAADVPVGNVYYYFKTKDELVGAAIDDHVRDIAAMLATFERHRTPKARLKALVRSWGDMGGLVAQHGCPHGSLCSELDKRDDGLDRAAAKLLELSVDWAEQQFRQIGRRDARDLAIALVAAFQGAALLTNTFREPELLTRQSRRLERWIDSLA